MSPRRRNPAQNSPPSSRQRRTHTPSRFTPPSQAPSLMGALSGLISRTGLISRMSTTASTTARPQSLCPRALSAATQVHGRSLVVATYANIERVDWLLLLANRLRVSGTRKLLLLDMDRITCTALKRLLKRWPSPAVECVQLAELQGVGGGALEAPSRKGIFSWSSDEAPSHKGIFRWSSDSSSGYAHLLSAKMRLVGDAASLGTPLSRPCHALGTPLARPCHALGTLLARPCHALGTSVREGFATIRPPPPSAPLPPQVPSSRALSRCHPPPRLRRRPPRLRARGSSRRRRRDRSAKRFRRTAREQPGGQPHHLLRRAHGVLDHVRLPWLGRG